MKAIHMNAMHGVQTIRKTENHVSIHNANQHVVWPHEWILLHVAVGQSKSVIRPTFPTPDSISIVN
jgi:hypothetical protein